MLYVDDKLAIACLALTIWPTFSSFLKFLSPEGSWKTSRKYKKYGKYWLYCTRNREITNAKVLRFYTVIFIQVQFFCDIKQLQCALQCYASCSRIPSFTEHLWIKNSGGFKSIILKRYTSQKKEKAAANYLKSIIFSHVYMYLLLKSINYICFFFFFTWFFQRKMSIDCVMTILIYQ